MSAAKFEKMTDNVIVVSEISFGGNLAGEIRQVARALEGLGFIAGGAARYVIHDWPVDPSDIDVFLYEEDYPYEQYANELEAIGYTDTETPGKVVFENPGKKLRVQVVQPNDDRATAWGPPVTVISGFTFTTEQFALYYEVGQALGYTTYLAMKDTDERIIRNNNYHTNPILSLFRMTKYSKKGYSVSMQEVVQVADYISRMTPSRFETTATAASRSSS